MRSRTGLSPYLALMTRKRLPSLAVSTLPIDDSASRSRLHARAGSTLSPASLMGPPGRRGEPTATVRASATSSVRMWSAVE